MTVVHVLFQIYFVSNPMDVRWTVVFLVFSLGRVLVPVHAQSSYDLFGNARADALGNATTALPAAVGVQSNPSSRASLSSPTMIAYSRQSYGLEALRYGATQLALPTSWGTFSGGASTFGFEDYREVHLSLGYARGLRFGTVRTLRFGGTLRSHHTSIAGYGRAATLGLNIGLGLRLLPSLHLGAMATNVTGASLVDNEPLPRTLAVGLFYRAVDALLVAVDAFKDVRFPLSVRGGLEVHPVPPLFLRAGVTTAPVRFRTGVGVRLGPIRADVAAEQHQRLGWSPSASLRVRWQ